MNGPQKDGNSSGPKFAVEDGGVLNYPGGLFFVT